MKSNIQLMLSYQGTHYRGWQKTRLGPTIEEKLEKALVTVLKHPIALQAASRTDAGVHAKGQVVNFFSDLGVSKIDLQHCLNGILPRDMAVISAKKVPTTFHPSLDSLSKEYHYWICNSTYQMPFDRDFSWHLPYSLSLYQMQEAAEFLKGDHDFSAFTNEPKMNNRCKISNIEIHPCASNRLNIKLVGNRFLYKMARILVGTLVDVGRGRLQSKDIIEILRQKDRKKSGVTAPAHGLFLMKVNYN